jgi:hypothetical protein
MGLKLLHRERKGGFFEIRSHLFRRTYPYEILRPAPEAHPIPDSGQTPATQTGFGGVGGGGNETGFTGFSGLEFGTPNPETPEPRNIPCENPRNLWTIQEDGTSAPFARGSFLVLSEPQNPRTPEPQNSRTPELQNSRTPELQNSRTPEPETPEPETPEPPNLISP